MSSTLDSQKEKQPTNQSLSFQYIPAGPDGFFRASVILESTDELVLIDGGFNYKYGESVADELVKKNKKLTTIYISQSDPDYYFSLKPTLHKFPTAKVIAAPATIAAINKSVQGKIDVWGPKLKANGPQSLSEITIPIPYEHKYLTIGSSKIEIIETSIPNRRYIWSEELKAIFGGVLVFSDVHVWTADSSVEDRRKWIATLESMIALNPKTIIPGHMQPSSAIDVSSAKYTLEYLKTFENEVSRAKSSEDLIKAMRNHYPTAGMDVALDIGAKVAMGEMKWAHEDGSKAATNNNIDLIKSTYEGKSGDNQGRLPALLDPNVEWTEAAGFPYAGTYRGPEQVIQHVFSRLAQEWEGYAAHAEEYISQGDLVIVFGYYTGKYKKTGKTMRADFVHRYELHKGRIVKMKQYVDSFAVQSAMI